MNNLLLFIALFYFPPQDSNMNESNGFMAFARKFTNVGVPFIFGQDKSLKYEVYEGDTIPLNMKNKYFPSKQLDADLEYGKKTYYVCPFWNDSIAGLISKVSHGTGYDFFLIVYDMKTFRPIDAMTLFWISDNGSWCEGLIDSDLTIIQKPFSFDKWWDKDKRKLKKEPVNRLKITKKGIEVIEGKKIIYNYW